MKKTVCLVLVLILCCTSLIASAEDFTLRSGILFGDTLEMILQKETSLVRQSEDSHWFDGRIAGFDGASCRFDFDEEEKLCSMMYEFDSDINISRDTTNSNYKTLYESLVRKYGSPEGNVGGACELITGPAIESMATWILLCEYLDSYSADYIDYDEWIVNMDDYNVKIDLVSYYYRDSDYEYHFFINLSYHMYTDADYQAELDANRAEREEVDSDL